MTWRGWRVGCTRCERVSGSSACTGIRQTTCDFSLSICEDLVNQESVGAVGAVVDEGGVEGHGGYLPVWPRANKGIAIERLAGEVVGRLAVQSLIEPLEFDVVGDAHRREDIDHFNPK